MHILITNDDGINAPGLEVLAEIAATIAGPKGEVTCVAPAFEQSGVGHCISYSRPMAIARLAPNRFAAEGETFSSWLLSQRLARAEEYLLAPAYALRSIEWIGFSCGFVATAHFHRAFKERFGTTPRTFRERGCSNGEGRGDFVPAAPAQDVWRGTNPCHGAC